MNWEKFATFVKFANRKILNFGSGSRVQTKRRRTSETRKAMLARQARRAHHICRRPDMEIETHTGQLWDADDYRNVRFVNAKRHVNKNFSLRLALEAKPKYVEERITYCDGGGVLGHPKVFICMDKPSWHFCFYCGQEFRRKKPKTPKKKP